MLENTLIIGLVMIVVELIKEATNLTKKDYCNYIIPLLVFALAGVFNVINAQLFGDIALIEALKEGLILGASAGGIYRFGEMVLEKGVD